MKAARILLRILSVITATAGWIQCSEEETASSKITPLVVLHWPEQEHVFRSGTNIVCAYTTRGFDPPRDGHVELLINRVSVGNYTPPSQDFEVGFFFFLVWKHCNMNAFGWSDLYTCVYVYVQMNLC
jgi:hypothetical protein